MYICNTQLGWTNLKSPEFNFHSFFSNVSSSVLYPGIELLVYLKKASLYKYALAIHKVKYGRRPDAQSCCCTGGRLGVLQSQPWKHTESVLLKCGISLSETTKKWTVYRFLHSTGYVYLKFLYCFSPLSLSQISRWNCQNFKNQVRN